MIHFFGDSFTYCQGCTPDHEYYQRVFDKDLCQAHRKRTNNQLSDTSPDRNSHNDCKNIDSFSFLPK